MKKEANFTPAAGQAISLIDAWVTDQNGWSIFDAIDDQHKVYLCDGGATDFYLYVDDDQSGYSELKLWEGWNSETHEGTGNNTSVMYLVKKAGLYRCVGNSTYISVYHAASTSSNWLFYAGYLNPLIDTDTKCITIQGDVSTNPSNSIALAHNITNGYFLFPFAGGLPVKSHLWHPSMTPYLSNTINNQGLCLFKIYVGEEPSNKKSRGTLQDFYGLANYVPLGFAVNDVAYIGETPFVLKYCYYSSSSYYFVKNA